ncbi:MAG: hypothetical protein A2Z17_02600 [Gammaproteobacteria bacterium RBG_16_66_13]|nr:MAG: hypothetical protein A2Z17_02600 [Gammaproteobacteria bacterium RBG_16_66_13]
MKIIDNSEFRDENGAISFQNRVRGTLRYGLPWYGVMQAQAVISERLAKSLTKEYTLLRNVLIPSSGLIASMILVGPQGVRALMATPVRGVFRAKGEEWLGQTSGGFRNTVPNLQQMAVGMAEVVRQYLRDKGLDLPELEAVLIFTSAHAHVDTAHPRARIVMADAIEHFAANLRQTPPIMDAEDVQIVVDMLLRAKAPEPEPQPQPAPSAPPPPARRPAPPPRPAGLQPPAGPFPESAPLSGPSPFRLDVRPAPMRGDRVRRRLGLSRRQRVLLGLLLVGEVLIVAVFALAVLLNTFI